MSSFTDPNPQPETVCRRCGSGLYKDVKTKDWRTVADQKLLCKGGGPHYPKLEIPKPDWDSFGDVLDSWAKDV